MKRILNVFICASLLFFSCSKNDQNGESDIRVTAFHATSGDVKLFYNESGQVSRSESEGSFQTPTNPWPIRTKTESIFEYQGKMLNSVKSQVTIQFAEPADLWATSFYTWDSRGRLKETYGENNQHKTQWLSDASGRLRGYVNDKGETIQWTYDNKGNVILPAPFQDAKLSVTYSKYKNPFRNGNTGIIQFVGNRDDLKNAVKYLSAYLPKKYELTYTRRWQSPDVISPLFTSTETIEYSYGFDGTGLLNSVTEHTRSEMKYEGQQFPGITESRYTYPFTCVRLNN